LSTRATVVSVAALSERICLKSKELTMSRRTTVLYQLPPVQSDVLGQDEIEKCQQAFRQFDKDGNGTIDFFELKAMLQGV
jgi:Ca2+-binding EF-hand superfamily protein